MILLYHLVFPDDTPRNSWNAGKVIRLRDFKRHISWLKKYYDIVSLKEYLSNSMEKSIVRKKQIVITFDDGYHSTFDLIYPFLNSERIPATFFLTTSHLEDKKLLWFVFFNALCFEMVYQEVKINSQTYPLVSERTCFAAWRKLIDTARASGDAIAYSREFSRNYPLPDPIVQKYLGLSEKQILEIGSSDFLELGGHTHHHPYLDHVSYEQQLVEMQENKAILERISKKPINYFAYTGGVYNTDSIAAVKKAGFEAAFSINPLRIGIEIKYEIPRTDIYSASLVKLMLKASGIVSTVRRMGF